MAHFHPLRESVARAGVLENRAERIADADEREAYRQHTEGWDPLTRPNSTGGRPHRC